MKRWRCSDRSHVFEAVARLVRDISLSTPNTTMVSWAQTRDTLTLSELVAYTLLVLGFVKELPVDDCVRVVDLVKSFGT